MNPFLHQGQHEIFHFKRLSFIKNIVNEMQVEQTWLSYDSIMVKFEGIVGKNFLNGNDNPIEC